MTRIWYCCDCGIGSDQTPSLGTSGAALKIKKSKISIVSFRISVALLIFCLEDLSIDVSGVLKSPNIIVFPSISPFMSASICYMYLGAPIGVAYMLTSVISSS